PHFWLSRCLLRLTPTSFFLLRVSALLHYFFFFFFHAPATPAIYTLSLHDALPISGFRYRRYWDGRACGWACRIFADRHKYCRAHLVDRQRNYVGYARPDAICNWRCRNDSGRNYAIPAEIATKQRH